MIWASWYKLPLIGDETFKDYIFINKETCCAIAIIFTDQLFHWFRKQLYVILSVPSDLRHFFLQILLTSLYRKRCPENNSSLIVCQYLYINLLLSNTFKELVFNSRGERSHNNMLAGPLDKVEYFTHFHTCNGQVMVVFKVGTIYILFWKSQI
jgi:hypothetical protein